MKQLKRLFAILAACVLMASALSMALAGCISQEKYDSIFHIYSRWLIKNSSLSVKCKLYYHPSGTSYDIL